MTDRPEAVLEEKLGFLFQPDVLISWQYFETFRSKTRLEPEKRLMLAVLEDAVQCFKENLSKRGEVQRRLFRDAEEWIFEGSDEGAFAFESVCDALGIHPEYLRRGLRSWKLQNSSTWQRARRADQHRRRDDRGASMTGKDVDKLSVL